MDFRGLLAALDDAGYGGWIVLEEDVRLGAPWPAQDPRRNAVRSLAHLRTLMERMHDDRDRNPPQPPSGGQIIAEFLVQAGVPYVAGIPGHGIWTVLDAFQDYRERLKVIQVIHEQSAVHLADGYYRASGRPMAAFTSIGPGATNTVIGVATAYVDSQALLLLTGSPHTYMRGHTVLQEIERVQWANFPRVLEPVTKQTWQPSRVEQLPFVLQRAWS